MGNDMQKQNYGTVGFVGEDGKPVLSEMLIEGTKLYSVEPALYEIVARIVEAFKQHDAERFEPVPTTVRLQGMEFENSVGVSVLDLRNLEAFMDAAGRTAPLADKAEELFLSGRASERWVMVAKPWQIGAAFANPSVGCSLTVTDDGYSACLVEAPSW